MSEAIQLNVNGEARSIAADPATPLLHALRNMLGLTGTHFGCGVNQCGACNVLIDGRAVASCDTPLWAAAGKTITTAEGLGTPEKPHPLQRAFIEEQAMQCGYCIAGILVSAAALLESSPHPSEAQVRAALDRNLCRCGAHNRMVRAVLRAARRRGVRRGGPAGSRRSAPARQPQREPPAVAVAARAARRMDRSHIRQGRARAGHPHRAPADRRRRARRLSRGRPPESGIDRDQPR